MNLAFPAQANTAALNQTAAGNNADGFMAGVLAFVAKHTRPVELSLVSVDAAVTETAVAAKAPGLFARLTESAEARQRRLDAAYMAEATDMYDVEYRSRELDRRAARGNAW